MSMRKKVKKYKVKIMVNDQNKNKLTIIAEIIGIIGGIITIISFTLQLSGINYNIGFFSILFKINLIPIAIISIILLFIVAIRKRMNHGKTNIIKHWHFTPHKKICSFNCLGFKWDVTIPNEVYNISLKTIRNNFDISPEPKCPNCDLKLDPAKDYIIFYKYDCFNCNFKKAKWDNLEKITDHANELFKKELDKKINNT